MTIIALRKERKMTQAALARSVGIGQSTLAGYESGARRPRPEIANRIGLILGLSKDELWEMFYGRTVCDLLDKQNACRKEAGKHAESSSR